MVAAEIAGRLRTPMPAKVDVCGLRSRKHAKMTGSMVRKHPIDDANSASIQIRGGQVSLADSRAKEKWQHAFGLERIHQCPYEKK